MHELKTRQGGGVIGCSHILTAKGGFGKAHRVVVNKGVLYSDSPWKHSIEIDERFRHARSGALIYYGPGIVLQLDHHLHEVDPIWMADHHIHGDRIARSDVDIGRVHAEVTGLGRRLGSQR